MANINIMRDGRFLSGRRRYTLSMIDSTGAIDISGYSRKDAEVAAAVLGPVVASISVADLAKGIAAQLAERNGKWSAVFR